MKYICPICGSKLRVERIDDGTCLYSVDPTTGGISLLHDRCHGNTIIYCADYNNHKIGFELQDTILNNMDLLNL